ncbi:hypothetical protein WBP06_18445 (plasmid) [Novosphingobium sp. BL-8H]|uniref:hypothetical protein n=1 Tax=Novosphingobium sp. BL-8H TaxID=3127640 RepID=UPI0037577E19
MIINTPESVLAYYSNPTVENAVDLVLGRKQKPVPADLPWTDLPGYYRAMAAARQLQFDYAGLLWEIWQATWSEVSLPSGAKQQPLDGVDPLKVWDRGCMGTSVKVGAFTLERLIYLDGEFGAQIGIGLWAGSKRWLGKKDFPVDWEKGDEVVWSPPGEVPLEPAIAVDKLRDFASEAMKLCRERVEP